MKYSRCTQNYKSLCDIETNEYISREKWAFQSDGTICPSGPFRISGQVVLEGTGGQMLRHPFFVIRQDLYGIPGIVHLTLLSERTNRFCLWTRGFRS